MAMGKGSTREIATAAGIAAGRSISQAMLDAGYSKGYANTQAGRVEARLRDLGLLPTPADALDALALLRETIFSDGGRGLVQMYNSQLSRAQSGDVGAFKAIMAYLVGAPAQSVAVTGADGGPVEHAVTVVIDLGDDSRMRDAGTDDDG